jgi:hypothetical protein
MDTGAAIKARALLSSFPDDNSCCFAYSRALIEFISLMLNEEGASEELRDEYLRKAYKANEYALWTLAFHETFADVVEHTDQITTPAKAGSIMDAVHFFEGLQLIIVFTAFTLVCFIVDSPLWVETEGVIDWVKSFIEQEQLAVPTPPLVKLPDVWAADDANFKIKEPNRKRDRNDDNDEQADVNEMFLGMFFTATEMATS